MIQISINPTLNRLSSPVIIIPILFPQFADISSGLVSLPRSIEATLAVLFCNLKMNNKMVLSICYITCLYDSIIVLYCYDTVIYQIS